MDSVYAHQGCIRIRPHSLNQNTPWLCTIFCHCCGFPIEFNWAQRQLLLPLPAFSEFPASCPTSVVANPVLVAACITLMMAGRGNNCNMMSSSMFPRVIYGWLVFLSVFFCSIMTWECNINH